MAKKKDKTQIDLVGRIPIAKPTVRFSSKKTYNRDKSDVRNSKNEYNYSKDDMY